MADNLAQQPEFDCLDVKLLDFIMAMCSQHSELKRKVEKNNLSHKSEMAKIKHRINMMENFLKVMTGPSQMEQTEDFREGQKSSKAIISAYADLQRKFTENQPERPVNGNGLPSGSSPSDNKLKWNVEAVERLLKEVQLAGDEKEIADSKDQPTKSSQIDQNAPIVHFTDTPPAHLPQPKPRNTIADFEKGRFPVLPEDPLKTKDNWTTVANSKRGTRLKCHWTFWVYRKNKKYSYEDNLLKGSNFSTWDHFTFSLNSLKSANDLQHDSKYIVFKSGHKPIFDDPINLGGGKWVMTFQKKCHVELNNRWRELLLCMVGGTFGENGRFICGAEVSVRKKVDKISVWIIRGLSQDRAWSIRKMIQDRLFLDSTVSLKFQLHPKTTSTSEGLPDFCF